MRILDESLLLRMPDGGAGDGGAEGGSEGAVVNAQDDAAAPSYPVKQRQESKLANVKYGTQPVEAEQTEPQEDPQPAEEETWESVRNGRFKEQFDADVQQIVTKRLRSAKDAESKLQKLAPALEQLGAKYGVTNGDIDSLIAKITDDDSLYEDEALERGMTIDALRTVKALERENAQMRAQQEQELNQQLFNQHISGLTQQGEALKQMFPNFDLYNELQDERFARLTSPEVGVSVEDAYWLLHRKEIEPQAMQIAQQKTREMISQSIQSGKHRPTENGVSNGSAAQVRSDPSKLNKADIDEIHRRIQRGEVIRFD